MKKLIVIAASLAAFAIAAWYLRSPPVVVDSTTTSPEVALPTPPADRQEPAQPAPPDTPPTQRAAASRTDEAQQMAQCRAKWDRERKAEEAARAAETDDSAWAHTTEAKLHGYLSRRLRRSSIEVTGIHCKETFCEITAQGFVPEGDNEFDQALKDVWLEPGSDFSGSSLSQSVQRSKVVYTAEVRRKPPNAATHGYFVSREEIACMHLVERQRQRQRDALDAQPRDAGWADPMEQMLRTYLMAQMSKHPGVQLDINCRTTLCTIKAKGISKDAMYPFQMAMIAVESEPWANLRDGDSGSSGSGENWTAHYVMHRR